jgi:sugar phosphate isomerase/epimerase
MSRKFYVMDTCFDHELGCYPLAARCEITKELGFDATYLTLGAEPPQRWRDLEAIADEAARHGLEVAGIYASLDLDDSRSRDRVIQILSCLPPGCALEIALRSNKGAFQKSSEAGDDTALRLLEPLLAAVDPGRNPVCLYPHVSFWLERHQDALRLIRKSGHPTLGWVFCAYHWYACQEGLLLPLLEEGILRLRRANFCGSSRTPEGGYTLEPLDSGTLDVSAIFGQLVKRSFAGPIGVQGYGVGGDVYANLRRDIASLRDWTQRFERHSHWADLSPPLSSAFAAKGRGPLLTT